MLGFIIIIIIILVLEIALRETRHRKCLLAEKRTADRLSIQYMMLIEWMRKKIGGKSVAGYLKSKGISHVAIYGMGLIGEYLMEELSNEGICVVATIDKKETTLIIDDTVPEVIIVTPTYYYEEILDWAKKEYSCPVISLDNIIYGL